MAASFSVQISVGDMPNHREKETRGLGLKTIKSGGWSGTLRCIFDTY